MEDPAQQKVIPTSTELRDRELAAKIAQSVTAHTGEQAMPEKMIPQTQQNPLNNIDQFTLTQNHVQTVEEKKVEEGEAVNSEPTAIANLTEAAGEAHEAIRGYYMGKSRAGPSKKFLRILEQRAEVKDEQKAA